MYRFFAPVTAPVLAAAGARRIIEIGAGAGDQSVKLAQWSRRNGAELDIVDPAPAFDTDAFLAEWGDCSRIHRALSLEVLPELLPADVVLIDGDHNWYTVFHEMRAAFGEGPAIAPDAPIAICHDVDFPYGRRDLYYAPETIPEEYRHPYGQGGLSPMAKGFTPQGMNSIMNNACTEGGPRNGVRTAIEDALEGRRDQVRIVWLPVLHGVAVIVPLARLETHPGLAAVLDQIEPSQGLRTLIKIAEQDRIHGLIARQGMALLSGAAGGRAPPPAEGARPFTTALDAPAWRDIQRGLFSQRYKGRELLLSPFDLANFQMLLGQMRPGCVIEVGSYDGGRALWLADMMAALGLEPKVITIDLAPPQGIEDERVRVLAGDAMALGEVLGPETMAALPRPLLVIEDSAHTREVSLAVLDFFDPHLASGDYIVIEDGLVQTLLETAGPAGVCQAITEFLARRGEDYEIDAEICDRFGYNMTNNPNGWLRRR